MPGGICRRDEVDDTEGKLIGDVVFLRAINDRDSWIDLRTFCISSLSTSIPLTALWRREISLQRKKNVKQRKNLAGRFADWTRRLQIFFDWPPGSSLSTPSNRRCLGQSLERGPSPARQTYWTRIVEFHLSLETFVDRYLAHHRSLGCRNRLF